MTVTEELLVRRRRPPTLADAESGRRLDEHPAQVRPGYKRNGGPASADLHRSRRTPGQQLLVGDDQRVSQLGRMVEAHQGVLTVHRSDLVRVRPAWIIEHLDVEP
ncbi:hypothetical protein [Streptomyces sp. NPDC002187]|uniref:hypothetical protein n=1 Tax=Streptomyces sp. NPDC002187 TaxID=3364637 RepID=UPI0036CC6960